MLSKSCSLAASAACFCQSKLLHLVHACVTFGFSSNKKYSLVASAVIHGHLQCCNPLLHAKFGMALQSFGVGTAAVGMTISAYALARLMMNLPAGILADRHGRKLLLIWGPALTAVGKIRFAPTFALQKMHIMPCIPCQPRLSNLAKHAENMCCTMICQELPLICTCSLIAQVLYV